eukprot:jgi/Tetstr1/465360/TSEL_010046.t1
MAKATFDAWREASAFDHMAATAVGRSALAAWAGIARTEARVRSALWSRLGRAADRRRTFRVWGDWKARVATRARFASRALALFRNVAARRMGTCWRSWRLAVALGQALDAQLDAGAALLDLSREQPPARPAASQSQPTPKPTRPLPAQRAPAARRPPQSPGVTGIGSRPPKSPSYLSLTPGCPTASNVVMQPAVAGGHVSVAPDTPLAGPTSAEADSAEQLRVALDGLHMEANARIRYQNTRLAHLRTALGRMADDRAAALLRRRLTAAFSGWRRVAALGALSMRPYRSDPFVVIPPVPRPAAAVARTANVNSYAARAAHRKPSAGCDRPSTSGCWPAAPRIAKRAALAHALEQLQALASDDTEEPLEPRRSFSQPPPSLGIS